MTSRDPREERFLERVRSALDEGEESIDTEALARLRGARARALEAVPAAPRARRVLLPAGALSAAAMAALALVLWRTGPEPAPEPLLEDLELLSSADSLELYQDLEFLEWLEADAQAG